jgi:hypothetical protein
VRVPAGNLLVVVLLFTGQFLIASLPGATPRDGTVHAIYESREPPRFEGKLDALVAAKLNALDIEPWLCSDAVFLRRVFIDLIGTLPTAAEAKAFLQNPDQNKRQALIDQLLERPEFADYWSLRWGDVLRIKAEFPINLWPNAAQAYHRWVHDAVSSNKPYDQFVRALLCSSGSNFQVGEVNFYRAMQSRTPDGIAAAVALTFMGVRFETLSPEQRAGMIRCFSQVGYKPTGEWKEEHVFWDPIGASRLPDAIAPGRASLLTLAGQVPAREANTLPKTLSSNAPSKALMPDGTEILLPGNRDPRELFADWLIRPENPWFARSFVNRVWYWLLGRGIVQEPDDFRPDNPPSNPALLDYLAGEFVASHYDVKHLFRVITTSTTYQFSSLSHSRSPEAEANFATYPLRRLDAEVLIDAINKITGTTDLYTSAIPEPFTYIPEDQPAIALPDGSITSPFLALFGRSARATGMENERINTPVPAQWLHMLNSTHIQRKLEQGPALRELFNSSKKGRDLVELIYLTILSRFPSPEEVATFEAYGPKPPQAHANQAANTDKTGKRIQPTNRPYAAKTNREWLDLSWALINSSEFLYRH